MQNENTYHIPVLLKESVDGLVTNPNGIYLDLTFGGGGHSREILSRLEENGKLFGLDQDIETLNNAPEDPKFTYILSNFRYLKNFMRYHEVEEVDGVLADLGVSSHHFDEAKRGFSFRFNEKLDMRMNQSAPLSAIEVLNEYSEEALADIFYYYGEIKQARKLAKKIVEERKKQTITHTFQLVEIIESCLGKDKKQLAPIFQALRIEVNQEMEVLKGMLKSAEKVLKKGGRLAVITYHSLEDRLVKNFIKTGNFTGENEQDFFGNSKAPFKSVGKMIIPTAEEIERNPRSRSAKLRIATKL